MSRLHSRAVGGTLAILVVAAMANVATALAQTQQTVVPTECGAGTLEVCGEVTLKECDYFIGFAGLAGPYLTPVIVYEEQKCEVIGRRTLYKDRLKG